MAAPSGIVNKGHYMLGIRRLRVRPHAAIAAAALVVLTASANLLVFRGQALATSFRIEAPSNGAILQDGNVIMVEIVARENQPGAVSRVEVALDGGGWASAEHAP